MCRMCAAHTLESMPAPLSSQQALRPFYRLMLTKDRSRAQRESIELGRGEMDALLAQFSLLADEALDDKNFDPSRIETLMELFEQEAYASWSANEAELRDSLQAAEASVREAEAYLDSLMEASMDDYRRSHDDAERASNEELSGLLRAADAAKKLGHALGTAATTASKKYMDAVLASATATMKSAFASSKVYPS